MFLCDRDGVVSCVNKGGDGIRLCNIIGGDGVLLLDTIDGDGVMLCDILRDDVVYDIIGEMALYRVALYVLYSMML